MAFIAPTPHRSAKTKATFTIIEFRCWIHKETLFQFKVTLPYIEGFNRYKSLF